MQVGLTLKFPQRLLPRCYPFQLLLILVLILSNLASSEDNKPPSFTATQYIFAVAENATIGTILIPSTGGVINATDEDDSSVAYQKVSETDAPQILLNSTSGALMVGSVLDRESTAFYSFPIVANDGNRGGEFLPTVTVQIVILDVNDNKPVFVNSLYSYSIEEGVSSGHQVNPGNVPIAVTDRDIGNNEPSTFSIVAGADGRFTIDPDGNIITDLDDSAGANRILDYETKPGYELTVRATNRENGPSGDSVFSEIDVTVLLIDINDEAPIFSASSSDQAISISEASTGSLFTFQAEDTDHPLIATTFTYSITFGNGQINGTDSFAINANTGVMSASMLDHETILSYTLVIQAREDQTPRDTAITRFAINVLDSNEYSPCFRQSSYSTTISEISTIGEAVLLVEAKDNDTSQTIIYSLDGVVDSTYFDIDSISGLISVRREFDRETQDTFNFTVRAQDSLSVFLTATAAVAVFIGDVNDNSPRFRDDTQTIGYDEKSTTGVIIYNVPTQNPIVDLDQGVNGQVKYSFQPTSTTDFSIDSDSGNITVVAMLDYITQPVYTLTIIATDQALVASTRRTGSYILTINVNDVNDNPPVLAGIPNQAVMVEENLLAGTFLFTVSASDLDAGLAAPLTLNISNSTGVPFVLTATNIPSPTRITAQFATSKALDFETISEQSFLVTIVASDGDNTVSGVVTITTKDVNDNAPIFTQPGGYTFSINESQPGMTVIATTVNASDLDSGMFGPVVYSKVGDSEMNFMVDSSTGVITAQNMLDADVFNVYRFSVVAADGGTPSLSTLVLITVNVTDLNDESPEILIDEATVYIDENTAYSNIFTFIASDGDRTSPNNQFKFSITGSIPTFVNLSSIFVIGEDNGIIATNSTLPDREQFITGIILNVTVTDLGPGPLTDTASLTIIINDKNDNAPHFYILSYTATLAEDFPTGESFLQVTAYEVNADLNTQIIYSLVNQATASGNPMQYLSIDSLTGNITVAKSLDYEVLKTLLLTLIATDGTFSDTSFLTVNINNVNDNPPLLSVTVCSTTLPENNSLSGFCSFSVSDADQDGTTQFSLDSSSFSIVPNFNEFTILYSDGAPNATLIVSSSLDFEAIKLYTLTINIIDKGTAPFNTASISLAITITGINEHAPAFAQGSYTFSMDESEDIDSLIGLVTATDMDDPSTLDGVFSYSIQNQASTFPFKIDSGTGAISLKTRVDYELDKRFTFEVFATDSTIGDKKTGTTTVIITVFNSNENPPVFPTTFSASIPENVSMGVSVVQVIATDLDRKDVITYSIIDPGTVFGINSSTGEIFTNSLLDYETTQVYYLLVKAKDNGVKSREANTGVTITILDVNDNDPQFDRAPVNSQILEGLANTFILLVSANDSDSTTNAEISYSVDPDTEFYMDPTSGRLSTRDALDRETNATFILMICATDKGMVPRSVCGSVTITVLDVNDNFPSFVINSTTSVDLTENSAGGQSVANFTVSDPDQINSFFFILADDGGPFSITNISPFVAEVSLSGLAPSTPLDREVRDFYSLVVTVNDGIRSTTHSFTVNVTDINDNVPSFELDAYIVHNEVLENSIFGTTVLTVVAIDNDISPNNDVQYSLLDSADNRFGINGSTGEIFVNDTTKLDYESMHSHTLQVESSDGTLSDRAIVYIPVGDVNDNPPNFLENSYNIQVLETIAIGTIILVVQASDLDSGTNGDVIYEISSSDSNVNSTFELSQSTGILRTISTLDADLPPTQYIFNISATDLSASNPLSSLVLVTVSLQERNEDTPEFSSQLYTASVAEGVNSISSVLTVSASELDSNAVITYSILDVNARTLFSINATTGVLSLTSPLDRERIATYSFTIVASDNDTPPRQGFCSIQISIDDTNDNTPSFLLSKYSMTLSESASVNTIVIAVAAIDGDATSAFNQISYILDSLGSAPFSINPTSGEVSLTGTLDFDNDRQNYTIGLNASDGTNIGIASLCIRITDENDIIPQINNTVLSTTLPENANAGTEVIDIDVDDKDTVGTITYSIISGDSSNLFVIDSSGRIILAGQLDFESLNSFTLAILVYDGLNNNTAIVSVTVSNSNDHAPTFNRPLYQISLVENDMVDTFIISFIVTDLDSGDDGSLSLLIDSATNTGDMFKVTSSPVTNGIQGTISSKIPLDRETEGLTIASSTGAAVWTLNVIAHDNNSNTLLRLSSTAEILITVTDLNDNTPQFTFLPLTAQISESSNIGTPVLTLAATDADFGTNAQISFQLSNPSVSDANKFSLNAISGELRTAFVLSRETNPTLTIVVEATDGTLTASGTVTVTVTDINDHNPEFSATTISVSIPENSFPGFPVTIVNATDEDDGNNGMISIAIIGGDPSDHFIVQNITSSTGRKDGQIEVAKDLIDRENQTFYELILIAEDGGVPARRGTATVTVIITDVNDNSPLFSPSAYTATISEDANGRTPVALNTPIIVSDADQGIRSTFSLSLNDSSVFQISETRVVSLQPTAALDREVQSTFDLLIIATDMGSPMLSSNATITISVIDINDNPPTFSPLFLNVSLLENATGGSYVTNVSATDIDSEENGEISYSIFSGSRGNFLVDRSSGVILTAGTLDRETTEIYNLVIVAFDSGTPFMSGLANVTVNVGDVNDNDPSFTQILYERTVAENQIGVLVIDLDASDVDKDENSILIFDFQNPILYNPFPFIINSSSGEISVNGLIDREDIDMYSFEVIVRDNASIPSERRTATANVIITISDVNDVAPFFPVDLFKTSIQETTLITTIVLFPRASDPDLGAGGDIIYSFNPESSIFTVDPNLGEIRLIQSLDIDSNAAIKQFNITLVATDQGVPSLSGNVTVCITILDENDNVPIFSPPSSFAGILENTTVDTIFITLTATDNDTNGVIQYEIVGGNLLGLFKINILTGEVATNKTLFNLTSSIFELTVRAFESGDPTKSSLTSLHIEIADTNDNAPFFCQTAQYEFSVLENSAVLTIVGLICGSDRDTGINGQFTFSILSGNVNSAFSIDQQTGTSTANIVVISNALDRENIEMYSLILQITDNGTPPLQSNTLVAKISILDENDGTPTFFNLPNMHDLAEDVFGGTQVFRVIANDTDLSSNAEVVFSIVGGDTVPSTFIIEPITGQIISIRPLDFNILSTYTLLIRGTDLGSPPNFNESMLVIKIIDVNNNAPVFVPPFETSILEDLPNFSFVFLVRATDADSTKNAELVYNISAGLNSLHFAINSSTGMITVNTTELDRESQQLYNLEVTACDKGIPVMCSKIVIVISIADANDHPPVFVIPTFSFSVLENINIQDIVGRVIATDLDDGANGMVEYSAIVGDPHFTISMDTGYITLLQAVDRETKSFYQLIIRAEDKGSTRMSANATVNITILDVNDNAPIISTTIFSTEVDENAIPGTLVFDVDATDMDEGANSRLTYSILGGHLGHFAINSISGEITVNNTLDAESTLRYEILILVSDSAFPPLTDVETLIINIIDINEHPPVFEQGIYYVNLPENSPSQTILINVSATDADIPNTKNSEISFFLTGQDLIDFEVDSVSGIVTTKTTYDREVTISRILTIRANNPSTTPVLEGSAQIDITITDINDEIPYFTMTNFTAEVSELLEIGSFVLLLTAADDDDPGVGNGRVSFSGSSQNSPEFDSSFRINSNGTVEVNGPLDRENLNLYTASAVVTDLGELPLSNTSLIYIRLTDENDVPPTFERSMYNISYFEDTDPIAQDGLPRLLLQLDFTDGDLEDQYEVSTFLIAANSPYSFPDFNISSDGDVFLNIGLDREIRDTYTLIVEVINTAVGHLSGSYCTPLNPSRARLVDGKCLLFHTSYIYLSVIDINDNSPVFSESLFIFAILDSISFNSEVGTIQATDADLSLFGEIIYGLPASQEFTIESNTGVLRTNVLFAGRAGKVISFDVTATDKAENRSRSSSVNTYVSLLNNDYILRVIVEDTVEVTQLCRNELMSKLVAITSYQVQFYEIKELIIGTTIFPGRTSVLFYAYDIVDGVPTLILQSELIRTIDDSFTDLSLICEGKISAVSNLVQALISDPPSPSILTLIMIVVCLAIFICGCMINLLALYQRLVGKQRLKHTEEYVYGGMEGLDILTTTQRAVVSNQALIPDELAFESQELKMDLFLDEIPEDEFISGSDMTSSIGGGSLLAKALDMPIDDDDDGDGDIDSDDFSVSAI